MARARVRVGLDGCYLVSLLLCADCLADELSAQDVPPPLEITRLRR